MAKLCGSAYHQPRQQLPVKWAPSPPCPVHQCVPDLPMFAQELRQGEMICHLSSEYSYTHKQIL